MNVAGFVTASDYVAALPCKILLVDDFEPFRRFVRSMLEAGADLQVIGEASDGLEAVRKAEELHPDVILLDIGLPTLNGIEVARRIHRFAPEIRIIFISQESSAEIAQEALSTGAYGYIFKAHTASELIPALEAVCQGRPFIGSGLLGSSFKSAQGSQNPTQAGPPIARTQKGIAFKHEVQFISPTDSIPPARNSSEK